jgi:uncharacterized protein (UPF0335 family)
MEATVVKFNRPKTNNEVVTEAAGNLSHDPSNAPKVQSGFAKDQLYSFVERLERLDEERQGLVDDMKEVRAEAKGVGFDPKIITMVLRRRKMDAADRMEQDDILDLYERAVREAAAEQVKASEAEGA